MFLTHALRAIFRAAVVTGDSLWKYVTLLLSGTPPAVTFISDASTNGNVLTLNGDTRPSNFNPYTPGYYSNYFDTNGSYLTAPANAAFTLGTNNHTIECWYYAAGSQLTYSVLWAYASGSTNQATNSYYLTLGSGGAALLLGSGGAWGVNIGFTAPTLNAWHHIAAVRNGNVFTIYIDGVSVGSGTYAANITSQASFPFEIGGQITGTGNLGSTAFLGYVSNFKFTNGTAVYTANFTPPTAPLTAITNTSLLTCQSNRLIDNSLNNFAITKAGNTTVSGFTPFTPPTSVNVNTLYSTYFDGTGDYLSLPSNAAFAFGTGAYTMEGWIYINAAPTYISTMFDAGGATNAISLGVAASGAVQIGKYGIGNVVISTAGDVVSNQWVHVAAVRTSTATNDTKLYVNGILKATGTDANNWTVTTSPTVGGIALAGYQTNGYLSNLRIVKGTAVYTANFTPPTAPLTAITNTSLLTCQDATIKDNSTNAFAITSNGQAQPVAQSPFTQTTTAVNTTYLGSGYFDGTGDYLTGPTSNAGLLMGTGDFTIEYWVYKTTSIAVATVVSFGGSGGNLRLFIDNATPTIWDGATSLGAGNAINLNSWNHIVAQRSGTTLRFYTNGISSATITNSSNFNAGTLGIGGGDANVITGYIADVRIVKGRALYTANFAPPAQPLTAVTNTRLLTLQTDQPVANKQFIDNSTNNFPITQFGNTTQGTFSPYGSNWSNYFDGTGDYLTAPVNAAIQLGSNNFTFEFWLYIPTLPSVRNQIFYWNGNGSGYNALGIYTTATNKIGINFSETGSSWRVEDITGVGALTAGTWQHIAVVRNGQNIQIYQNGTAQGSAYTTTTAGTSLMTTYTMNHIGMYGTGSHPLTGYVSNFRLVNGTALYTTTFTPSTTPLTAIANTSLLTCQDNRLIDNSPNAFTITKAGDVSVQEFSPFGNVTQTPQTYSGFFDGTGDYLTSPTGNATLNTAMDILGGDYTVEFWMYKTLNTNQCVLTNFTASGVNGWEIRSREDGAVEVDHWVSNSSTGRASTFFNYSINTWVHIAVVKLSGNYYFYINGTEVGIFQGGTRAAPANGGAGTGLGIGTYIQNLSYPSHFTGYLSNLRVVKGTAVYTANFTPSTTPLTAISGTSLLVCQSPTFIDNSANAFPLTSFGNVTPRAFNPFGFTDTTGQSYTPALFGGSAYFDGTGDYLATPATGQFVATGDFTIQFSFYLTSLAATNHLIGNYTAAVATDWLIEVISTGAMQVFLDGSTQRLGHSGITTGQWYHVSITRSGTTVTGRINGVPMSTTSTYTMSGTFGTATKAIYMGMRGGSTNPLFGYLSDISLINGTAVYKSNFVPPLAPLTATAGTSLLLNMDKGGVADSSRSVDLETVGDAKIRDETPYAGSYYSNYFDGTGDYFNISGAPASLNLGSGSFTAEFWINPTSISADHTILSLCDTGSLGYAAVRIDLTSPNSVRWLMGDGGSWPVNQIVGTVVIGAWTHLAICRSGTSVYFFINGIQVGTTTTNSTTLASGGTTHIGLNSYGFHYAGYISNLRVLKGTALYTANFTPSITPLTAVANTSLLTCQSKSFVDNSASPLTLTRNGDVAVRSQNPFQKNTYSSMFFDGTGDYLTLPSNPAYVLNANSDFTIEFWCYPTVLNSANMVLGSNNGANSDYFSINPGSIGLGISTNATGNFPGWNFTFSTNTWRYITLTRTSGLLKCYVDGNVLTLSTGSASETRQYFQSNVAFLVGIYGATNPLPFTGYIADLRITKSARYTANFTPPTAPLPTA